MLYLKGNILNHGHKQRGGGSSVGLSSVSHAGGLSSNPVWGLEPGYTHVRGRDYKLIKVILHQLG